MPTWNQITTSSSSRVFEPAHICLWRYHPLHGQLAKNINWSTRFNWNSNLTYTSFEWQNDFSFQLSKYINATLHIYPRYNDSNPGAKNKNGRYFFFKESLSMGMNYSF